MKNLAGFLVVVGVFGGFFAANGESLLKVASFPKTFNDLPFISRIEILADGYGQVESVYDGNGVCVSGCAYVGITIEQELDAIQRNTMAANHAMNGNDIMQMSPFSSTKQNGYYGDGQHISVQSSGIRWVPPIHGDIIITSDFGPRAKPTDGATGMHRGIDIRAKIGTPVYAAADGIVNNVWNDRECGRGVLLRHNNGFYTKYCHLNNNSVVAVGDSVVADSVIGYSGNAGVSTGPHLHYAIYHVQNGNKLNSNTDAIDPLWVVDYLGKTCSFKGAKSCLHNPNNFCGDKTGVISPARLPCEEK